MPSLRASCATLVLPPAQIRLVMIGHAVRRGDEFHRRAPRHAAVADLVSRTFLGCIGNGARRGKGCASRLFEPLDRCVDVVGVESEVRDAEVARPDGLGLFGAMHFEQFDIRSGPDLDHRLRAHDRSWERANGSLEFGAMSRRVLRSERLIDQLGISSADWFGAYVLPPIPADFSKAYPNVDVEILTGTRLFNLAQREADVAFRIVPFDTADVIQRRLFSLEYGVYIAEEAADPK